MDRCGGIVDVQSRTKQSRYRPMTEEIEMDLAVPQLTANRSDKACLQQAANAVIRAIGGCAALALVPLEFSAAPTIESIERSLTNIAEAFFCNGESPDWDFLRWDEGLGVFSADRKAFDAFIGQVGRRNRQPIRRQIRVIVCVALSGPIAKAIQDGEPEGSFIRSSYDKMAHDMSLAEACCRLLPFRHEIFHLADKTEHLLRNPDIWQAVIRLADLLETKEPLETERLIGFLPSARPHWPPPPKNKQC